MRVPVPPLLSSSLIARAALAAFAGVGLLSAGCIRDYEDPNAPTFTADEEAVVVADGEPAPADDVANREPFRVEFDTTQGPFVVETRPDWAPLGAARFKTLVEAGYFDNAPFFRVVPGFVAQFGLAADPAQTARWEGTDLKDEPVLATNTPGRLSFAKSGPNTRTTQMFVNLGDNSASLDPQGFSPFAEVVSGGEVPGKLYGGYGERGPDQGTLTRRGADYSEEDFPKLDKITAARVIPRSEWADDAAGREETDEPTEAASADLTGPEDDEMQDPAATETAPEQPAAEETPTEDPAPEDPAAEEAMTEDAAEAPAESSEETPTEEPAEQESADEGSSEEPAMTEEPSTPPEPGPEPEPQPDTPPTPDPTPEPADPPEPQPDPTPEPDPTPDPSPEPEPEPDPAPEAETEEPPASAE